MVIGASAMVLGTIVFRLFDDGIAGGAYLVDDGIGMAHDAVPTMEPTGVSPRTGAPGVRGSEILTSAAWPFGFPVISRCLLSGKD